MKRTSRLASEIAALAVALVLLPAAARADDPASLSLIHI